jgi:hypothetical protein
MALEMPEIRAIPPWPMRHKLLLAVAALVACSGSPSGAEPGAPPGEGPPGAPSLEADGGSRADAGGPGASGPTFTVLSLNLHCLKTTGTAFTTNEARFAAIAKTAHDEGVLVIVAQEVCERPGTSTRALLGAALASATGVSWSSEAALAHPAWEGTSRSSRAGRSARPGRRRIGRREASRA